MSIRVLYLHGWTDGTIYGFWKRVLDVKDLELGITGDARGGITSDARGGITSDATP
ncbi:hypothetical protein ACF073_40825 [Streptomyces sp. NPDC015171]|uniref:hypothetical protein n=1 Tax=Streptomyces sp. NPDC015171 TaxID=3364945 RepID=UPI0036F6AB34